MISEPLRASVLLYRTRCRTFCGSIVQLNVLWRGFFGLLADSTAVAFPDLPHEALVIASLSRIVLSGTPLVARRPDGGARNVRNCTGDNANEIMAYCLKPAWLRMETAY